MLELSKGKLTSEPDRHNGRGLFFTSRLADVFDLHANPGGLPVPRLGP
jgi:anti-sigma regulatory factor (Ser/Thr protein kinase)